MVNFVRNVLTAIPADLIDANLPELRILVVVAQPIGTGHLSVEEETEVIRDGFRSLTDEKLASIEILLDATPSRLHRLLESPDSGFDAVHFIGHGEYNTDEKLGYLLFENEDGGVQELDAVTLRQILCRRDIKLVFLNACETGSGGSADFKGVAQELIAGGIPAVVANQYSVLDSSATAFARHFYWSLAHGRSIGDAAREARVAVSYSISGEAIDWAVPVVFARNPADRLCASRPAERAAAMTRIQEARESRRSGRQTRRRIGLWDPHRTIPKLREIAQRLSQAQESYQFDAVYFPTPIGTWKQAKMDGEVVTYLYGPRVAERLKDKPRALGLDQLICITQFWLRDEVTLNLYAWWDPDMKISIFSTAEVLDRVQPPETSTERMIANLTAAFLSNLDAHARGPKRCPSFWNEEREIEPIAGHLEFCKPCRAKLKKQFAKNQTTAESLEALLHVF